MIYRFCKAMILKGMTEGLGQKLDVLYAAGRLTEAEYEELAGMLTVG